MAAAVDKGTNDQVEPETYKNRKFDESNLNLLDRGKTPKDN